MRILNTMVINGKRFFAIQGIEEPIERDEIIGNPKVGQHVIATENGLMASNNGIDVDCPNGRCPTR